MIGASNIVGSEYVGRVLQLTRCLDARSYDWLGDNARTSVAIKSYAAADAGTVGDHVLG